MIKRLRSGELLVLAGSICLIVSMFVPWYTSPIGNLDMWDTFGPAVALILASLCAGLAVVVTAVTERGNPSLAVATVGLVLRAGPGRHDLGDRQSPRAPPERRLDLRGTLAGAGRDSADHGGQLAGDA